jgi:CubicO group peptidase (beta-lactamase class C family)
MLLRIVATSTLLFLAACTQQPGPVLSADADLKPGMPTERKTLALHAADTFRLGLSEKAFVYGNANQLSVDVVVSVINPSGKQIAQFDSPARGPEPFSFQTDSAGVYRLVVSPFQENSGDYVLTLLGAERLETDVDKRIGQVITASVGSADGPGAAVAVVRDGKIIYSKGFGHSDLEHDAHITPTTVFHIASVSKQFTAFAIAMLADQGKLSIHDDIRKYLPEMHDFGTPITINHLVHHTSGLRDQWNLLMLAGWRLDDVITKDQIMRLVSKQRELNFKPGEEMVYCNTGFTLMAEIVSRVTGQSFADWTQENIFKPLDMSNTLFYDDHEKIVYNRAYSYQIGTDGFRKSVLSYANAGATSLFTTVEDLSKWANNFDDMKVGNERVMKMMEERFVLNNGDTISYAFGQSIGKHKGLRTISHGGADAGYRSYFLRFPDQHMAISVFSNLGSFNPGGLAYMIADLYLADELKPDPTAAPGPEQTPEEGETFDPATVRLADFTGRFYSPELETTYSFVVINDTLVAQHQRHDDMKLEIAKQDEFASGFLGTLAFTRGKDKKVSGLRISNGRVRNLAFDRVD